MLNAFNILTKAMDEKGDEKLFHHGKFSLTYREGSIE